MSQVNILILDGESPFTAKVVRSLSLDPRWQIHVLARAVGSQRPALAWSRHVRSFHLTASNQDDQAYLACVRTVAQQTSASAILPVIEPTSLFCIRHRAALEEIAPLAPLPAADTFVTGIDKGLLAAFMVRHAIPHPRTCLPPDPMRSQLTYPLLVKPRRSCGGRGFAKVESPEELQCELARRPDRADVCLQEYIEGIDVGCSVLVQEGNIVAWTTQRGLRRLRPYAALSEMQMEASIPAHKTTGDLMKALNWSGIAHVDLRIDARTGQPLVLEINGRYWDSLWASTAARVNFPDLVCRMTLGEALPAARPRSGRFVQPRALRKDFMRLLPRLFQFRWNGLSMILADPVPEILTKLRSWQAAKLRERPA